MRVRAGPCRVRVVEFSYYTTPRSSVGVATRLAAVLGQFVRRVNTPVILRCTCSELECAVNKPLTRQVKESTLPRHMGDESVPIQLAQCWFPGLASGHFQCSVHQAAKLVAALLRVAGVTAGLAESNDSLPPSL